MTRIHSTAIVDPHAEIANNVVVGPYSIIEANVQIGNGTQIGPHAHICSGARLGQDCKIFTGAVVGSIPQDLKFENEVSILTVGDRTTIREYVSLNRGTKFRGKTVIGCDCLIMAYAHVAHDCIIGNHCILANSVNLAGHVIIEDWATLGGMVPVHQFVRIGQHSFIGGGYRVGQDVPPYILAAGEPLEYHGLNSVGLRRRNFPEEVLRQLKRAYKIIYKSNLNISQAVNHLRELDDPIPEVKNVLDFIAKSERGLIG